MGKRVRRSKRLKRKAYESEESIKDSDEDTSDSEPKRIIVVSLSQWNPLMTISNSP